MSMLYDKLIHHDRDQNMDRNGENLYYLVYSQANQTNFC